MATDTIELAKNQLDVPPGNELNVEGEARLYRAFRHFWHPVLFSHEMGEDPMRAVLCGQDLVVARLEGDVRVFNDLCAHRGTALSLGKVVNDGTALRCPYHGWQYDKEGICILAPQRPDLSKHLRARIRRYNAVERYGMVWVCLEDEPHHPLPDFAQYDDPTWIKAPLDCDDWTCSAPRRIENYCDLAHFAWVHDGTLGDSSRPEIPDFEVWKEDRFLRMKWHILAPGEVDESKYEALGVSNDGSDTILDTWVDLPLNVLHQGDEYLGGYALFFHATPLGPKLMRNFTIIATRQQPGADPEQVRRDIREFQAVVYGEDKPIVQSQRPEELPEDLSYELHLKGVDTFHILYRRSLNELAKALVQD